MTDNQEETIKKWESLLEGLPSAKYKRYKYCRIYENIVKHNDPKDYKLLLSLAYRVFSEVDDLEIVRKSENTRVVGQFIFEDLYDENGSLSVDRAKFFLSAITRVVTGDSKEKLKIAYIDMEKGKENVIKVHY